MTGKEILEEEFEKAGMRGGYKADQVDAFLQRIAAYVDEQNAQKSDLTYKMQILADKIEEYKKDEENIREALLGAQKLGTSIMNEAKSKADAMTREARSSADEMLSQARAKIDALTRESKQKTSMELSALKRECEMEQRNLEKMKQEVSNFKAFLLKQYKAQLQLLTTLPSAEDRSEPQRPAYVPPEPETVREPERPAYQAPYAEPAPEPVLEPAPIREEPPAPPETVQPDLTTIGEEIAQDVREQTKEFGEASPIKPESASRPPKQNYIEKFGELKFGSYSDGK